jgi:hypothetical protein
MPCPWPLRAQLTRRRPPKRTLPAAQAVAAVPARERARKRLILVSNLESSHTKAGGEGDAAFLSSLAEAAQRAGAALEVVELAATGGGAAAADARRRNGDALAALLCEVDHAHRVVACGADLAAAWPAVERTPSTAYAKAELEIAGVMRIKVKVALKARKEGLPPLGRAAAAGAGGAPATEVSRELWREDDPGHTKAAVPQADAVRGFRYGRQFVPIDAAAEAAARYAPPRACALVGTVAAGAVPRHAAAMAAPMVMVADRGAPEAGAALAALVEGLRRAGRAAVLRAVLREPRSVALYLAEPVAAAGAAPAHLALGRLPLAEDARGHAFGSLDTEARRPTPAQRRAAGELVAALTLNEEGPGAPAPERVPHAALHRFYQHAAARALAARAAGAPDGAPPDAAAAAAEESDEALQRARADAAGAAAGDVVDRLLELRAEALAPGAAAAAKAAGAALGTGRAAATARAVHRLRPGREEEDLCTMFEQSARAFFVLCVACVGLFIPRLLRRFSRALPPRRPALTPLPPPRPARARAESYDEATTALFAHVVALVEGASGAGDAALAAAAGRLALLRALCVERAQPFGFNGNLRALNLRYGGRPGAGGAFWAAAGAAGVTLVSSAEVAASQVPPSEAAAFLARARAGERADVEAARKEAAAAAAAAEVEAEAEAKAAAEGGGGDEAE